MNFKKDKGASKQRNGLLAGMSVLAVAAASAVTPAMAQDAATSQDEEIVVTGSRIVRPNEDMPTATIAVTAESIANAGATDAATVLRDIPAAGFATFTPQTSAGLSTTGFGLSTVDLRNLTESRTLVLVNGRRFVSGVPGAQIVDFNSIPTDMIQRVDVVTGGASSIYGSDALAGVINIITKTDIEGLTISGQTGITDQGDDENYDFDLVAGSGFSDGKGHASIGLAYYRNNGVFARDRTDHSLNSDVTQEAFLPTGPATSTDEKAVGPLLSSFSAFGRFNNPLTGDLATCNAGDCTTPYSTSAFGFNRAQFRALSAPLERYTANFNLDYEFNEHARFFSEVNYSSTRAQTGGEPFPINESNVYGNGTPNFLASCDAGPDPLNPVLSCNGFGIPINSAVVPADLRNLFITQTQQALAAGPDGVFGDDPDTPEDESADDLDPNAQNTDNLIVGFRRRLVENHARNGDTTRQTYRFVVGFDGDINPDWTYNVSLVHGKTNENQFADGQVNTSNFREALNAEADPDNPGQIRCVDPTARSQGCVPINIFGLGAISDAAAAYVSAPVFRAFSIEELVLNGYVSGTIAQLPGGALQGSFGAEYREEHSSDIPDALTQSGQNASNKTAPSIGGFNVKEVFGELRIPIFSDSPLGESLELNLSARGSEYTTVGKTFAWSGNVEYRPTHDLMLRAQYSRAVRAPNVGELFGGVVQDFPTVSDPCNGFGLTGGTSGDPTFYIDDGTDPNGPHYVVDTNQTNSATAQACAADPHVLHRATVVDPTGHLQLTQPELQGVTGFDSGNRNLRAETSDSYTAGIVYHPTDGMFKNLSLSVDYFNIKIDDGIGVIDEQLIADKCYLGPTLDPSFCQYQERVSTGPFEGALLAVNQVTLNLSTIQTEGVDVQLDYPFDLDSLGRLDVAVQYSHLIKLDTRPLPGAEIQHDAGEVGSAEDKVNVQLMHTIGPFQTVVTTRFIGPSVIDNDSQNPLFGAEIGWRYFMDAQLRYQLRDNASISFGVDNLLDEYVITGGSNSDTLGNVLMPAGHRTAPAVYDALGRRFYLQAKVQF